jgi:hypothetical protein
MRVSCVSVWTISSSRKSKHRFAADIPLKVPAEEQV